MIFSMDLNSAPLPEEDNEEIFEDHEDHVEGGLAVEEHIESAVETSRRVGEEQRQRSRRGEEQRQRSRREYQDEGPNRTLQHPRKDPVAQTKRPRSYDRFKPPSGWLDCPPYGKCIDDIIPSKVPLGESFFDSVAPGKRYSWTQVIEKVAGRGLGLVIDLTNTTRYYSPKDWKDRSIKHVKIACKGRDSVPDNESVNNFVYEVLQYKSRQKQSKRYIFVHCTHGHNRTGYMIIHFLMRSQLQPISVTEAIERFANARPPGIYKQDYIDALYTFYHERKPETVICPPTPEWKISSDFDLNGEAVPDEDDDGGIAVSLHDDHVESEVMTNDDVLGDAIPIDQQDAMRQFCYQTLKLTGAKRMSQFPGSHPVSFNRENLQLLRQRYYYATWKADGTRYMMLLTRDGCYLIDRNFCFRRVQMRFLTRSTNEVLAEKHSLTLLDGEMIIDTVPDTLKQERRYLIYDLMAINGMPIVELPFYERWKMLEKEVIEPRNVERQHIINGRINHYYRYDLEPFRVRRKDFWLLSTVHKVLNEFIPRLPHAADGLIFQGWDDPYVPRTHEGLLKWKYPEMNSVDFLFEMEDQDRPLLYLHERGNRKLMEGNRVVFKGDSDASAFSGKIIECSWDSEKGVWVCMRIRADKSTPNEFNTYKKVMRSIRDNITEDVLLNEIGEIVRLPMYAERTRNDSKAAQMHHRHPNSARRR